VQARRLWALAAAQRIEEVAATQALSSVAGTPDAFPGAGAVRRQLSPLAGGAWECGCLMHMIDDAASTIEGCFYGEETIWSVVGMLRSWMKKYGTPLTLYTDWESVYVREATEFEKQAGKVPVTQFCRMCRELGSASLRPICACETASGAGPRHASGPAGEKLLLVEISSYEEASR
jgi:hypothetical protein